MLFSHAADVMQATAYFLERENVRSLLDPVDEVRHKQILGKCHWKISPGDLSDWCDHPRRGPPWP